MSQYYNQQRNPNFAPQQGQNVQPNVNAPVNQIQSAPVQPQAPMSQQGYQQNNFAPVQQAPMQAQQGFNQAPVQAQGQQVWDNNCTDFSNYVPKPRTYNGNGGPKKVFDRFVLEKFTEFDHRPDIQGLIAYLKDQLKDIKGRIGMHEFQGVCFLKLPYDVQFLEYLKNTYHICFYKNGKMWACNAGVAPKVMSDLQRAVEGTFVMPSGAPFMFAKPNYKKKNYGNNNNFNGYQQQTNFAPQGNGFNGNNGYNQQSNSNYQNYQ